MTSFSSILSSINQKPDTQQVSPSIHSSNTTRTRVGESVQASERFKLTTASSAAGVKRKSDELDSGNSTSSAGLHSTSLKKGSPSSNRYQLSIKSKTTQEQAVSIPVRESSIPTKSTRPLQERALSGSRDVSQTSASNLQSARSKPLPSTTNRNAASIAPKKGFASILEKAKAAQVASQATSAGGIKHKPIERISRRDRQRMIEEAKAQKKLADRDKRQGGKTQTANKTQEQSVKTLPAESSYKGTMKKAAPESSYKGTMRAMSAGGPSSRSKQKGLGQDKYGGYASWSDLDEAEDDEEEEQGYDSYESDDMEGGFDELENEEAAALRAAKKEDQAALEEEEKHRQEKLARKRRLEQMNKAAAAKRRY